MSSKAVANVKPIDRFKQELGLREGMLKDLLPKNMTVQKFQAIVVSAVADNMDLLDCDRGSLLKSCLQAAELGLSLNKSMAEADILKVWNGRAKRNEAQFRPRYKGLMKLALQGGDVLKIESRIVYANDTFEVEEGIDPRITHKHGLGNRGEMIGAYCVWKLRNGESQFEVMSKEEIEAIRDRSSSKTKEGKVVGPWMTDPAEMWRKTVVRRATKYMPLSTEAARAVHIDNVAEGVEDIDGDIVEHDADDITSMFDEETGEVFEEDVPTERAESQLDQIAQKMEKKPTAKSPPRFIPAHISVPMDDDGMADWQEWAGRCVQYLQQLKPDEIKVWVQAHRDSLDEAEMVAPDDIRPLLDMI